MRASKGSHRKKQVPCRPVVVVVDEGGSVVSPSPVPTPKAKRPPRPKLFGDPAEAVAEAVRIVRGSLIAALDRAFCDGELGRLLGRDHPDRSVRERALDLFQALMVALFPEEFGGPGGPPGVVPRLGPRRVGADRLRTFAAVISGGRQRGPQGHIR